MKLKVTSVPLIFPFAKQFHVVAVCLWDLLILVGWSACNSFCFSSPGDPLHAVSVRHISAVADPLSLSVLVALLSSLLLFKALKWSKRRMRSNKLLLHLFWQGWSRSCEVCCGARALEGVKCYCCCFDRAPGSLMQKWRNSFFPKICISQSLELSLALNYSPALRGGRAWPGLLDRSAWILKLTQNLFPLWLFKTLVYGNSFSL